MALRAITFDFWNTLVDGSPDRRRAKARLECFLVVLARHGHPMPREQVAAAIARGESRIAETARRTARAVVPAARWQILAQEFALPEDKVPFEDVRATYRQFVLDSPAPLMPGAGDAVRRAHAAGFRLGVVSNTGFGGGSVLRELLSYHGLLNLFDITIWSDEAPWCKPDPRVFQQALRELGGIEPSEALHIGDDEVLDVGGAKAAGLSAARYVAGPSLGIRSAADMLICGWHSFPGWRADDCAAVVSRPGGAGGDASSRIVTAPPSGVSGPAEARPPTIPTEY